MLKNLKSWEFQKPLSVTYVCRPALLDHTNITETNANKFYSALDDKKSYQTYHTQYAPPSCHQLSVTGIPRAPLWTGLQTRDQTPARTTAPNNQIVKHFFNKLKTCFKFFCSAKYRLQFKSPTCPHFFSIQVLTVLPQVLDNLGGKTKGPLSPQHCYSQSKNSFAFLSVSDNYISGPQYMYI